MSDDERFYRGVELEPAVVVELARLRARRPDIFAHPDPQPVKPNPGRSSERGQRPFTAVPPPPPNVPYMHPSWRQRRAAWKKFKRRTAEVAARQQLESEYLAADYAAALMRNWRPEVLTEEPE